MRHLPSNMYHISSSEDKITKKKDKNEALPSLLRHTFLLTVTEETWLSTARLHEFDARAREVMIQDTFQCGSPLHQPLKRSHQG